MKPYVVKSLPEHERLIALARFPWILRAASWTILAVLGAAPIIAMFILYATERLTPVWATVLLGTGIAGTIWFISIEIYILSTEFGLTDQRVVVKRGVIARSTAELPIVAVENVLLRQSLFARLFRFGRLQINGSGGSPIFSPPIADPVRFRAAITEAGIARSRPSEQAAALHKRSARDEARSADMHPSGKRRAPDVQQRRPAKASRPERRARSPKRPGPPQKPGGSPRGPQRRQR